MAKLLIVGKQSNERDELALVLEFAGHQCATASSLQEVATMAKKEAYQLVLADSSVGKGSAEETVRALRGVAPRVPVLFLTEEVDPRSSAGEVVTTPTPPGERLSTAFSVVPPREVYALLLPKPESFRQLAALPQTPAVLNRLAVLYQSQEEYETAEQLYKKALNIAEKASRKAPGDVASLLNNLASLYHEQRKFVEAEPLYGKSLEIVEKTFGPKHPKVARRLRNLADLYQATGRSKQAAPLLERLQTIRS